MAVPSSVEPLTPAEQGFIPKKTRILSVHGLNTVWENESFESLLRRWNREVEERTPEATALLEAAEALRTTDVPVAFPTETVYGLGADATRSEAVLGIYRAKQRPSDNPLIVHVSSLDMLRRILRPAESDTTATNGDSDPIPPAYRPLISRFWPGPLTIILPSPEPCILAPEVRPRMPTFGVRMPSSPLARLLIHCSNRPLAAPSANASTKPSPTTAQHVDDDLHGRIDIILDGGSCGVGVESTVVDGLCDPPLILRPGGVGIDELRTVPGWEQVQIGYKDGASKGSEAPRAPGMKYRHYSPKAKVVLFEAGHNLDSVTRRIREDLVNGEDGLVIETVGVVRTKSWKKGAGFAIEDTTETREAGNGCAEPVMLPIQLTGVAHKVMYDLTLGTDTDAIARGLFSALRCLDQKGADIIYIEGVSDTEGDRAAAVMNRLRKAAEVEVKVE